MFERAGMLAPDGRCKALDANADGYVRAEGCEVVMLKHSCSVCGAVVASSSVNQDGRSSSLTAPNGPSQHNAIKYALANGNLASSDITGVQMHGTGTSLGDPIEVGGILGALGDASRIIALGAIKSSVGHAECAAGVTGLVRAAYNLTRSVFDSIMHLRSVNPHVINAVGVASNVTRDILIPRTICSYAEECAATGVSSFAFQGTNAHAIVAITSNALAAREIPSKRAQILAEQRYWVTPLTLAFTECVSPKYQTQGSSSRLEICIDFADSPRFASILDHRVRGRALFPAAGFLEAAAQTAQTIKIGTCDDALQNVVMSAPLLLDCGTHPVSVIGVCVDPVAGAFTIQSHDVHVEQITGRFGNVVTFEEDSVVGAMIGIFDASAQCATSYSTIGNPADAHGRYIAHPAVLDATFQLDAVCSSNICIPALVDAASSSKKSSSGGKARAAFLQKPVIENFCAHSTRSTHMLTGSANATCEGLVCKPVRTGVDNPNGPVSSRPTTRIYVAQHRVTPTHVPVESLVRDTIQTVSTAISAMQAVIGCSPSSADVTRSTATHAALRAIAAEGINVDVNANFGSVLIEKDTEMQMAGRYTVMLTFLRSTMIGRVTDPTSSRYNRDHANWLVTGGTGAIGGLLRDWLTDKTCGQIFVTGRTGKVGSSPRHCDGQITLSRTDSGERSHDGMLRLKNPARMVHASGVLDDASLHKQTSGHVRRVFAPKVSGAEHLHEATAGFESIDLTVLFSSMTAQLGSGGQSNYSAANAVLDALSRDAAYSGNPTVSIQWGAWAQIGMAARNKRAMESLSRIGLAAMAPDDALRAFDAIMGTCGVQTVCAFDWPQLARSGADLEFFDEFLESTFPMSVSQVSPAKTPSVVAHQALQISDVIKAAVIDVIGNDVGMEDPLMAAGLDSLVATELATTISSKVGVRLSSTLAFDHPTISLITAHVISKMASLQVDVDLSASAVLPSYSEKQSTAKVGIRAISGSLSGVAVDQVQTVPLKRWDIENIEARYAVKSRMGNVISDVEMFDPKLFGIHAGEAVNMDPQHRLLLKYSMSAVSNNETNDYESKVGAFIGIAWTEYTEIVKISNNPQATYSATSTALSVASGRLAFCFNLRGPTLSVDTACSSSLVAAHLGTQTICTGECASSVIGGVNLTLLPNTTAMFERAGMLAPDGRCKALDANADGYVRAEGCEVVMLKHSCSVCGAVVASSSVNQDGRSSSLTAPNGPSQHNAIKYALANGNLASSDITGVQMHGTGTSLGDPIEVGGILGALGDASRIIALGAIKSSVGHAECAAGVTGLVRAAYNLTRSVFDSIMHLRSVNPHVINAVGVASNVTRDILIPRTICSYAEECAATGVSSFAFQGTNAHAIVAITSNALAAREIPSKRAQILAEQRYWVTPLTLAFTECVSPKYQTQGSSSRLEICIDFADSPRFASILDHRVRGRALFPAAGFLEAAAQTAQTIKIGTCDDALQNVVMSAPLLLDCGTHPVSVIGVCVDPVAGAFTIQSHDVHVEQITGRFGNVVTFEEGSVVGAMIGIFDASAQCATSYSTIGNPADAHGRYIAHPAVLDATFQLDAVCSSNICIPALVDAASSSKKSSSGGKARAAFLQKPVIENFCAHSTRSTHMLTGSANATCEGLVCKPVRTGVDNPNGPVSSRPTTRIYVAQHRVTPTHVPVESLVRDTIQTVSTAISAMQAVIGCSPSSADVTRSTATHAALRSIASEGINVDVNANFGSVLIEKDTEMQMAGRYTVMLTFLRSTMIGRVTDPTSSRYNRDHANWLVTGGTGAIGGLLRDWLTDKTCGQIFVTGRTGKVGSSPRHCDGQITLSRTDSGERSHDGMLRLKNPARMVHASGVLDDASLHKQTSGHVRRVFAPKVSGAEHLHEATAGFESIDLTVLFSSMTAQLGSGGQSNYSAANAVLDALSRDAAYSGNPTVSIQWGCMGTNWDGRTQQTSDGKLVANRFGCHGT
jgi:3-oxoacyl-(acyl-carrier-protein) synthase/acyl carrier protein/predicted aconitase with swiveling domain